MSDSEINERAIRYAMDVLEYANDWQVGQHALADHPEFGPWLEAGGDPVVKCQNIIREAEERLGDVVPTNNADDGCKPT